MGPFYMKEHAMGIHLLQLNITAQAKERHAKMEDAQRYLKNV
jgi:hypothetical protein